MQQHQSQTNRIKLGISSFALNRCYNHNKMKSNSTNHLNGNNHMQLSSSDLDDIFLSNLKLLNENSNANTSNPCNDINNIGRNENNLTSNRYQSSLNIFIKPKQNWRHSSIVDYSFSDAIPVTDNRQMAVNNKLKKSSLLSSYEALYDSLLYSKPSNGNISTDSDRTLKSSSSVSSISSNESGSLTNKQPEVVKVRNKSTNIQQERPSSCYISQNSNPNSQKPPLPVNPSNIIISRPLGACQSNKTYNPTPTPIHFNDIPSKSHLQITPSSNILNHVFHAPQPLPNNQFPMKNVGGKEKNPQNSNEAPQSENVSVPPPVVPQRKKRIKVSNLQYHILPNQKPQKDLISSSQSMDQIHNYSDQPINGDNNKSNIQLMDDRTTITHQYTSYNIIRRPNKF